MESPPLRVLFVVPGAGIAGLNTILSTLIRNLRAGQVQPTLVLEKTVPARGRLDFLTRLIRRKRIRIVHSFDGASTGARAAGLLNLPHIWSIAGTLEDTFVARARRSLDPLPAIIEKLSRVVTIPSRALARSEFPDLSRRKLRIIPWGVDRPVFMKNRPRGWLRKKLGFPAETRLVALVANFHPAKRHLDFLQAAQRIRRVQPQTRFLIAGRCVGNSTRSRQISRRWRTRVLQEIRSAGLEKTVRIAPFDPNDWASWYREIDLLISPSREGMSMAVLQAGACGVPVIAAESGGSPEVIRNGRTGFLVPLGQPAEMAGSALKILRSPELARRLGNASRRRILARFSSRKQAATFTKLYRSLISPTNP